VARGAHAALSEADVALVLALAADDRERDRLVDLAALRLDGLLVVHGHGDPQLVESLVGAGVPTVFAGRTTTEATHDLWWVDSDNASGAQLAVEHLLSRGRRRIAHISGPLDMVAGQDRIEGWRLAHEVAAVEVDPALVETGNFSTDSGRVAMQALLARVPDLDAVFAANDLMAIGAQQVLREAGRDVPGDVAVVGFDDIDAAAHAAPPLTTVAQDIDAMGRRLAELLLLQLAGDTPPQREVLPTALVIRSST
jgi:DNA-binding LacI/PurR family transcriptional regulator